MKTRYDVLGIGNAIVDVLSMVNERFIEKHGLVKSGMTLVESARAEAIYADIGQSTECSGGSAANTLAGLASLGASCAFIGKVAADQLGRIFTHDMRAVGVHFATPPLLNGPATANCLVLVTPDAQRTMATFIGACACVSEEDIDVSLIDNSQVIYIEGYLWDAPKAKAAIRKAIALARRSGRKIAFTLSDTFCVNRHRDEFLQLMKTGIDIVLANESELLALFETDDFDDALRRLKGLCPIAAVTRSEKGSVVLTPKSTEAARAYVVDRVIDTTGAGDLFAAGFLFGYTRGWELKSCADLGNGCAARIIQQLGARCMRPLNDLVT